MDKEEPIIQVKGISKKYVIRHENAPYKTFQETIINVAKAPFNLIKNNGRLPKKETFWALKDISFDVNRGEVIGIIGRNGAGKTTLLKILSRITEPTEGMITLRGRVASLLEIGTGFHPELAGRENVYLNGAVLGMTKKEIDSKFDEIVKFAEVEKFLDTPVKRYSSGMYVRLAFSVAAHLEPEILLVDEVLAVGDIAFQKKCIGKMEDVAEGGRTVLFVSHNMGTISTLCERVILLTEGRVDTIGPTHQVVSTYLANLSADVSLKREWSFEEAPGGENIKIKSVTITDHRGIEKTHFSTSESIFVTVGYWILKEDVPVNINLYLFDEDGNWICSVGNYTETRTKPIKKSGLYRSKCTIPRNLLNSGKHTITVLAIRNAIDITVRIPHCVAFETVDDQRVCSAYTKWAGIIKPDFEWQSERIGNAETTKNG